MNFLHSWQVEQADQRVTLCVEGNISAGKSTFLNLMKKTMVGQLQQVIEVRCCTPELTASSRRSAVPPALVHSVLVHRKRCAKPLHCAGARCLGPWRAALPFGLRLLGAVSCQIFRLRATALQNLQTSHTHTHLSPPPPGGPGAGGRVASSRRQLSQHPGRLLQRARALRVHLPELRVPHALQPGAATWCLPAAVLTRSCPDSKARPWMPDLVFGRSRHIQGPISRQLREGGMCHFWLTLGPSLWHRIIIQVMGWSNLNLVPTTADQALHAVLQR